MEWFKIISNTISNKEKIKSELEKLKQIYKTNYFELTQNILNIDKILFEFNSDYLIDSDTKIYKQIIKENIYLVEEQIVTIYFYSYQKDFYNNQSKKGFELGSYDDQQFFVCGVDICIEAIQIKTADFKKNYFCVNN